MNQRQDVKDKFAEGMKAFVNKDFKEAAECFS